MARVSTHMDVKPYQVAMTTDPSLEFRKWRHMGTYWAISSMDVAYSFGDGEIIKTFSKFNGAVFQFSDGQYIYVGL